MNEQQQRMAAVGTDKELSDLLDFSAVREWESSLGGSGGHWEEELKTVRLRCGYEQRRSGGLNVRSGERVEKKICNRTLRIFFLTIGRAISKYFHPSFLA